MLDRNDEKCLVMEVDLLSNFGVGALLAGVAQLLLGVWEGVPCVHFVV